MENVQEEIFDIETNLLNVEEDEIEDLKNEQYLMYKKRIKNLIKEVAQSDGFEGISIGREALDRLQDTVRYITVIYIFEIIKGLRDKGRKQIKPFIIDEALNRTIGGTDGIGASLSKIEKLFNELQGLNKETSVAKATEFINLNNISREEN